ncbi:retrovirus-related pol polyprotein from transposon TNT 1-94, partial [Tanacetum coccineum]
MTGNRKLFSTYKAYNGGNVIFGSNLRGNIIGKGTISNDSLKIDNVEHVDNLGFNLLSIGQICDNKCKVTFSEHDSEITKNGKVIGRGIRKKGLYVMKLGNKPKDQICLATIDENSTLWHRRLGHANMRLIQSLASKELVRNLPRLKFDQHFCDACKIGKQAHASHKAKNLVSTTRCLELLHMDLFGPSAVRSYGGNRYTLVIVDDYSRYTWTRFLKDKTEAFDQFEIFSKKIQNQLGCTIVSIRTDHGREFDNEVQFGEFCNANGITHNFSAPRTPQSNGVVERKNRTLQEMSRTMLNEQSLPQKFWCNAVDTSTYILNRILIRAILGKTPYEILRGRKPTLDYFRVFGSKCFILNTKDYLTKFDPKSYEGVFLGYSQNSKAYIILNKHTRKIEESLNVTFDETPPPAKTSPLVDDDLDEEEAIREIEKKNLENNVEDETLEIDEVVNIKESRNHPLENVIGNLNQRTLRSQAQNQSNFYCFISTIEPKNVNEALGDESWIVAMQEELNQFIANDVWELVPQPKNMTVIGTKWVFRNKLDENGIVSRNKARLVAQGYNQQEGIDYDETYAPCMQTRSSSKFINQSSSNPSTSNPLNSKRRNRRRSKQRVEPFALDPIPVVTMEEQRTMAELLRAPIEGYAEAIVVPPIPAEHFELKHSLINLVTSKQFFGFEKEDPHTHIRYFNKITSTLKYKDVPDTSIKLMLFPFSINGPARIWFDKEPPPNVVSSVVTSAMTEVLKKLQPPPPPASVKAVEESCVTCGGSYSYRQCPATDGNTFFGYHDNIQGYVSAAATNYNQGNAGYRPPNVSNQIRPPVPIQGPQVATSSDLEKIKKMNEVNIKAMQAQIDNVKNELRNEMKSSIQASMSNQTNELKNMMASFFQMNTAFTSGSGSLPSNTVVNPKGELKAITTRSGLVLDGPSVPIPPPFINPEEDEREEETFTDQDNFEFTIKDSRSPNIPYPSRMNQEKQKDKDEVQIHKFWQMFKQLHVNISFADALILIPKYQKMLKSLLSNKEKLIELANTPLSENCSAVILKKLPEKLDDPGKFLISCGFSELKCKALADLGASINLMPLSVWKKLGLPELIPTLMTLELANRDICTPKGIARHVFVP